MTHPEPAHDNAEGEEPANRITYNRKRFFLLLLPGGLPPENVYSTEAGNVYGLAPVLNPCSDVQN